jgi:hypothetical protein
MPTAPTVVCGSFIERPVIVVENEMLAFEANHIRDASEVSVVFGDYESTGIEREYHSRRIDETTLIIIGAGILLCRDCNVRRVLALTVLYAIGAPDEDCVVGKSHSVVITMTLGDGKEIRKSAINRIKKISARHCPRKYCNAFRCGRDYRKPVAGDLLGSSY